MPQSSANYTWACAQCFRRGAMLLAILSGGALVAPAVQAQAPAAKAPTPAAKAPATPEARIYNLTSKRFVFQLHRADGVKWTDGYVVQPGKFVNVAMLRPGDRNSIMGLSGNGRGFVIIRFQEPKLGGYLSPRLPGVNPANQELQPTWFAVEDSNGITRVVQYGTVEEAKAAQESLKKLPPMTPAELERTKQTLRANWVLTN